MAVHPIELNVLKEIGGEVYSFGGRTKSTPPVSLNFRTFQLERATLEWRERPDMAMDYSFLGSYAFLYNV